MATINTNKAIPFLDLHASYAEARAEFDAAYHRVMDSGWYLLGTELDALEGEFAAYCDVEHCVGVGNGLDALYLILRAMDIGVGHEVIVPAHTFIATWLAVTYAGATPIPVDVDEQTFNMDPALVEAAITERTRCIMPVHLYGQPANMAAIAEVAQRHGIPVVEDAAQAHGAHYRNRRAGGLAHAAAFSFYPGKNLGAFGDAGAVTTDDAELADRVRILRNYGSRVKYQYEEPGTNSRMSELTAAMLRVKLARLDEWNARRKQQAEAYLAGLHGIPGLILPAAPEEMEPVWHLFVVRHEGRDDLQQSLKADGIGTLIHYPVPPHRSQAYNGCRPDAFPVTDRIAETVLSLPIGPHLSPDDQSSVIASVARFCDPQNRRGALCQEHMTTNG